MPAASESLVNFWRRTADFFGLKRPDPLRLFELAEQIPGTEIQFNRRGHARPLIAESGQGIAEFLGGEAAGERAFEDVGLF